MMSCLRELKCRWLVVRDDRKLIVQFDRLVREGELAKVRLQLVKLPYARVARGDLVDFSNLARRAQLPQLAIRILRRVIHPSKKGLEPPTPRERASYASSLAALGAQSEAREILKPCSHDESPEVLLTSAFLEIYEWSYDRALPLLERYLEVPGPTPYQRVVARLNLGIAASFIGQLAAYPHLLAEIKRTCIENNWGFVALEAHLLEAQEHVRRKDWPAAHGALDEAETFAQKSSLDTFYIRKWRTICSLHENGFSFAVAREISSLKEEATRLRNFETLRDCDYHLAVSRQNEALAMRVFFGTPFRSYQGRVLVGFHQPVVVPEKIIWELAAGPKPARIELQSGRVSSGAGRIDRNGMLMKILRALSRDFYRPVRIGGLFSLVYPGEFFDPNSSPIRIRTALSRARRELRALEIPLEIVCRNQEYNLKATAPCRLEVALSYPSHELSSSELSELTQALRTIFTHRAFTAAQAAAKTGLPVRHLRELLKTCVCRQEILRIGVGRGTMYRLATIERANSKRSG